MTHKSSIEGIRDPRERKKSTMTKREIMCAYGNCQETMASNAPFKITITESGNGSIRDRQSFCCYAHAILWLQALDKNLNGRTWPHPIGPSGVAWNL